MADVLEVTLVRVTVVAGTRRVDLALPGAVPVAELVPEVAGGVGLLEPATAHRGFALLGVDGRRLAPSIGLRAQGVVDGAVLVVAVGVDAGPRRRYDDASEALSDAVEREILAGSAELLQGIGATTGGCLGGYAVGLALPEVERGVVVSLAMLLVGSVLATGLLPRIALATSGSGAVDARRAHRILTGLTVAAGLLLLAVAPLAVTLGPWGIGLAVSACLAVLLGLIRPRAKAQVLAAATLGIAGLSATVASVQRFHPAWRGGVAAGIVLLAVLLPVVDRLRRTRAERPVDLVEALVLTALLPLLLLASGLLDRLPR